jgi:hypothetical protein
MQVLLVPGGSPLVDAIDLSRGSYGSVVTQAVDLFLPVGQYGYVLVIASHVST